MHDNLSSRIRTCGLALTVAMAAFPPVGLAAGKSSIEDLEKMIDAQQRQIDALRREVKGAKSGGPAKVATQDEAKPGREDPLIPDKRHLAPMDLPTAKA